MRKHLTSFLILAMFVSTIVCGCAHEARAEAGLASHSHHDDGEHHHDKSSLKEFCQKTDMQLPADISAKTSDFKTAFHFDFTLTNDRFLPRLELASGQAIRGPPPWGDLSHAQLPIFLTTQRLRI